MREIVARISILAVAIGAYFSGHVLAQNASWNVDANGNWGNTTNWAGGMPANGSNFTATFANDISADRTVILTAPQTIGNLIFGDADNTTAGSWTLTNGGTAANILTLSGTSPTITVNALGTNELVRINAVIAGNSGLIKNGPGSLLLEANNTFSGGFTLNAGTLIVNGNNTMGTGNVLTINGGTIAATTHSVLTGDIANIIVGGDFTLGGETIGNVGIGGNLTFTDNMLFGAASRTITIGGSGVYTLTRPISGAPGVGLSVNATSTGVLVLSGANTYNGPTNVNSGNLQFNSVGAISGTGRNVFVADGATVTAGYSINNGFLNRLAENSNAFNVNLAVTSASALDLSSSSGANLPNAVLTSPGNISYGGALTPNGTSYRFGNPSTGTFSNATIFTVSSPLSGAANSVTISGTGIVSLTGASPSYGGGTVVKPGAALGISATNVTGLASESIQVGADATIFRMSVSLDATFLSKIAPTNNPFTIIANNTTNSANLDLTNFPNASLALWDSAGTTTLAFSGIITPGAVGYRFGSTRATNNINLTTANALSGANTLTKIGPSNLRIQNSMSYTGDTTISGGTLQIYTDGSLGAGSYAGNISNAGLLQHSSSVNQTLSGVISGPGAVLKDSSLTGSSGTLTLTGANTYTGSTTVRDGTLTVSPTGSITTSGNIYLLVRGVTAVANLDGSYISTGGGGVRIDSGGILNSSGTVNISGDDRQAIFIGSTNSSGTWNVTGGSVNVNYVAHGWGIGDGGDGTLNVSGGTVTTAAGNTFQVGYRAGGTGSLNISGTGLVTITAGTGSFRIGRDQGAVGVVNLNGGTLALGRNFAKFDTATGTFNFNGGSLKAGLSSTSYMTGLTTANVRNGGAKIDTNSFDISIGQALLHSTIGGDNVIDGGLTKSGNGILTLTGANTYNGGTTVTAGTLQVSPGGTVGAGPVTNNANFDVTRAGLNTATISGTGTTTVTAAGASLTANHIRQSGLNIGAGNTVTIADNGTSSGTSVITNFSINATGKLDLANNDLIVNNGNLATLTAKLATGLDINGTYGNGPGITSSAFASNPNFNTVLGIAANVELGYTSFSGQTVDANDILIKYTYYGDADLSGSVDTSTDFDLYITGLTSGGSLGGWLFGDFDYSGTVDSSTDFDLYITGLTTQGGALLTAGGDGSAITAIPEPSTWVLAGLGLLGFAGVNLRRRRAMRT